MLRQHGKDKTEFRNVRSKSHVYFAIVNNSPRGWVVSFRYHGTVKADYESIRRMEAQLARKYGDRLVHVWTYDDKIRHEWVGMMLTEMQLRAHFGIDLPARFLRGEASPKMTDYLNDRS